MNLVTIIANFIFEIAEQIGNFVGMLTKKLVVVILFFPFIFAFYFLCFHLPLKFFGRYYDKLKYWLLRKFFPKSKIL